MRVLGRLATALRRVIQQLRSDEHCAHVARPIVAAESFTAGAGEAWRHYPGAMKAQADWALCTGINRLGVSSLSAPAVARPPAGHDDGTVRRPLGPHANVVGHGRRHFTRTSPAANGCSGAEMSVANILYLAPEKRTACLSAAEFGHARQSAGSARL